MNLIIGCLLVVATRFANANNWVSTYPDFFNASFPPQQYQLVYFVREGFNPTCAVEPFLFSNLTRAFNLDGNLSFPIVSNATMYQNNSDAVLRATVSLFESYDVDFQQGFSTVAQVLMGGLWDSSCDFYFGTPLFNAYILFYHMFGNSQSPSISDEEAIHWARVLLMLNSASNIPPPSGMAALAIQVLGYANVDLSDPEYANANLILSGMISPDILTANSILNGNLRALYMAGQEANITFQGFLPVIGVAIIRACRIQVMGSPVSKYCGNFPSTVSANDILNAFSCLALNSACLQISNVYIATVGVALSSFSLSETAIQLLIDSLSIYMSSSLLDDATLSGLVEGLGSSQVHAFNLQYALSAIGTCFTSCITETDFNKAKAGLFWMLAKTTLPSP